MMKRRRNQTENRKTVKEQVVQIIVSDPPAEDGTVDTAECEENIDEPSTSTRRSRRVADSSLSSPNEVIVMEGKGRTKTVVKSNYQTRRKTGVLARKPVEEERTQVTSGQNHHTAQNRKKKGRKKCPPVVYELAPAMSVRLKVNDIDCSDALEPGAVERDPIERKQAEDEISHKIRAIIADASSSVSRERTLKAKILLEQITNYKAKAFKFSMDTAIEYMKWHELNSKSYEFVRSLYGDGLFTLPSVKTMRRYVDPFSESVQLTNLEAAQTTLQQIQEQGEGVFFVNETDIEY